MSLSNGAPMMTMPVAPANNYGGGMGMWGDSDFLRAEADVPPDKAWEIMDELMDSLKIVNERVYNSVMRKLVT